jgi:hypothetical protein
MFWYKLGLKIVLYLIAIVRQSQSQAPMLVLLIGSAPASLREALGLT